MQQKETSVTLQLLCLHRVATIQEYSEKYAVDQDAFFKDYAEAHAKLSNLGAKFDPPEVSMHVLFI